MLVEKSYYLGGLGTSGLVTIYLPICDGMGRQVSYGIAEELLKLSVEVDCNGKRGVKNWLLGEGGFQRQTAADIRIDRTDTADFSAVETGAVSGCFQQLLCSGGSSC